MGNFCPNGSSSVGHEEISVSTKPLPAVKHGKNPVNQKAPPPVVVMPPARGSNPKFPVAETRTIDNTTRKKQQEKPRSVDDPSREKQHEKKPRSVETPPSNPVEKQGVGKKAVPPSGKIVTPNLKMFTLTDLMTATKNFRPESMIGEGGFGQVFKGWVDEETLSPSRAGVGIPIAVKKSNPDSAQGLHEWQAKGDGLTWDTRLKIAIEAAQGLTFLHNSEKSVIYRDFKASNILLDSNFNAKLSDFGLAKHGPINGYSHVTTRVMGTQGYAAPEYVATGHLYVLSDVYGFGVVLLELLTGLRALDPNRPSAQQNLVEWAKPVLTQKKKIQKLMDPRLENKYPLLAVSKTAALILRCLEADPKNRPPMDDVLRELEIVRTIREQPKEEKRNRNNGHGSPHVRKTGRTR
uniref:Protein kinase domain-containing protein n=1 Tax=Brassica campestris TaxID=3711 RepID=M4DGY1_BRACM